MTEIRMQLEDWLDDLCVRFIINLPEEDLSSVARICFQVEEAQWFYEDFIRPLDPSLPSMSLRSFCLRIFQHCPLLSAFSADNHMRAFEEFLLYKTRVPVRGAIMLNETMDSVVLVKGWKKGANWSFPRGKINKDEDDLDCAVREVYEETGFDIKEAGLVSPDEEVKYIEITMREQHMRLYVFRDVPMDTHFEPRTRKEISKIQWYRLSDLPAFRKKGQQNTQDGVQAAAHANKFYMVAPFLVPLKKWVVEQKKKDAQKALSSQQLAPTFVDDTLTEEELVGERGFSHSDSLSQEVGLDTMEGATAALHRLLKIKPPTQGLQPEAASAVQSPASKSSGEALLALLQGKSQSSEQHDAQTVPIAQTAQNVMFSSGPIPVPDHLGSEPPLASNTIPFTLFPLQHPDRQHSYDLHYSQLPPQSGNHPDFHHTRGPVQRFSPPYSQGYRQQQYHPQQLQHPQPLPPQVQRAVFTSDQAHGPAILPSEVQEPFPQHVATVNFHVPQPQFPNTHGPMIPAVTVQDPPKLTNHSLALLNAFKSRQDQQASSPSSKGDIPVRDVAQKIAGLHLQPQELSADESQNGKATVPEITRLAITRNQSASSPPAAQSSLNRTVPSDNHRTSLLNLFKASSGKSGPADVAATITTSSDIQQGSEANSSRQPSVDPSFDITSRSAKVDKSVKIKSQLNKTNPFSPLKSTNILLRPSEVPLKDHAQHDFIGKRQNNDLEVQSNRKAPAPDPMKLSMDMDPDTGPVKVFQPQILKRPQPAQPSLPAELAAPSPTLIQGVTTQPTLDRRDGQPAEHKQALLSLFRNGSTARPATQPEQVIPSRIIDRAFENKADILTRSRVGSLASAGGEMRSEDPSRRSSHAPISAADKGFLLGYLDAIARGKDG